MNSSFADTVSTASPGCSRRQACLPWRKADTCRQTTTEIIENLTVLRDMIHTHLTLSGEYENTDDLRGWEARLTAMMEDIGAKVKALSKKPEKDRAQAVAKDFQVWEQELVLLGYMGAQKPRAKLKELFALV